MAEPVLRQPEPEDVECFGLDKSDTKSPRMPPWATDFFDAYAASGQVKQASEKAGISREAHYHQLKINPAYQREFEVFLLPMGPLATIEFTLLTSRWVVPKVGSVANYRMTTLCFFLKPN